VQAGAALDRASGAIILTHGRGGSADDILGLGAAIAPACSFSIGEGLALLAPEAADHTWYPYSFLAPRAQNEPFLSSALARVQAALTRALEAGIPAERIAFCGFSQGACLATEFVGRHPTRYGGLIAYTGGLIGPLNEPISLTGELNGTPVLLSSGDPDPHVPWKRVQQSADLLTGMGGIVTLRRYANRPHTVLPEEVREGKKLLSKLLLSVCVFVFLLMGFGVRPTLAQEPRQAGTADVAVGPQYDSTHVYVTAGDADRFVKSFLGTFGGTSTQPVITTVTPTPSQTSSRLLKTPVGLISLFTFRTPIPAPFGAERTGYLVSDMDAAIRAARLAGADVVVTPFPDPIGRDAVIQWPGGVYMQLYWHTTAPSYPALPHIPENRVYVSADRFEAFTRGFLKFSHGKIVSDDARAPGIEIGDVGKVYRRVRMESRFGKMWVAVTDGHLLYPYGRETTGYEVDDVDAVVTRAKALGVTVIRQPRTSEHRRSAMVQFPGGYIAEIHSIIGEAKSGK
jgi:predicted esterase/predicted enzyme related to lactoylglutathione lyase